MTLFRTVLALAMVLGVAAAPPSRSRARPAAAAQADFPRLYVLDCGTIISRGPEGFGLRREEVCDPNFSDPCFLVMHPKGMLLFDTGLTDAQVGRPIYENKNGYEGMLKSTTLKGELANIGVTPAMITYLAISHSHWDHVGNANDYAGSTWLARKAEYDVMFGPNATPGASPGTPRWPRRTSSISRATMTCSATAAWCCCPRPAIRRATSHFM